MHQSNHSFSHDDHDDDDDDDDNDTNEADANENDDDDDDGDDDDDDDDDDDPPTLALARGQACRGARSNILSHSHSLIQSLDSKGFSPPLPLPIIFHNIIIIFHMFL